MNRIVGIGQIHTDAPVTQASEVSPLPLLIETPGSSKLTMRASPLGPMPAPSSQPSGAYCWPGRGACFTSQYTKDEAEQMCRSGERPQKIPGKGCPRGARRIDTYGSFHETSASQFDPCLIKDFPVCSGGRRLQSSSLEFEGGIFGLGQVPDATQAKWYATFFMLGAGIGLLYGNKLF